MIGVIKKVDSRNFGFIKTSLGVDYFFHRVDFKDDWQLLLRDFGEGVQLKVIFETDPSAPRGPKGINVRRYNDDGSKRGTEQEKEAEES